MANRPRLCVGRALNLGSEALGSSPASITYELGQVLKLGQIIPLNLSAFQQILHLLQEDSIYCAFPAVWKRFKEKSHWKCFVMRGEKQRHVTCIEVEVSQPQQTGGLPARSSLGGFILIQSLSLNSVGSETSYDSSGS